MSNIPSDLETLRKIFSDRRVWFAMGKITEKEVSSNQAVMRVKVNLLPDNHEIVARVGWPAVGPNAGNFGPISVDDMALVALCEGSEDQCYVVSRLSSEEDTLPLQVNDNHTISKSLLGKKNILWGDQRLNLVSPTRINLSKTDSDVTQPVPLGTVLKNYLDELHQKIDQAPQIGFDIFGLPVFLDATLKAQLLQLQLTYLTTITTNILSQLTFTERGGA